MIHIAKKYTFPLVAAVLLAFTTSCEKEIDVDLRSVPPRIVIEGMVKEGFVPMVRVSTTIDFDNNNGYPLLSDAIVKISDDNGVSEILRQDNTGWYVGENIIGEPGITYSLLVEYEDKQYTATSQMPPKVPIDSLTMYKIKVMDYALPMVHFTDPKGLVNQYYRCLVYINGKQRHDTQELVASAEFTDGSPLHLLLPIFSEDDDEDPIKKGDKLLIEAQSIDRGAYKFFNSLSSIENSLTNPISNITGGALGVFSAFSYDQQEIVAEWEE